MNKLVKVLSEKLTKPMEEDFDRDYPNDETLEGLDQNQFVGSLYDVYAKGWHSGYTHKVSADQTALTTLQGEVERYKSHLETTHRKFNALVKMMIKDGLLPEKQIDECCQILEANNILLYGKTPISHE